MIELFEFFDDEVEAQSSSLVLLAVVMLVFVCSLSRSMKSVLCASADAGESGSVVGGVSRRFRLLLSSLLLLNSLLRLCFTLRMHSLTLSIIFSCDRSFSFADFRRLLQAFFPTDFFAFSTAQRTAAIWLSGCGDFAWTIGEFLFDYRSTIVGSTIRV